MNDHNNMLFNKGDKVNLNLNNNGTGNDIRTPKLIKLAFGILSTKIFKDALKIEDIYQGSPATTEQITILLNAAEKHGIEKTALQHAIELTDGRLSKISNKFSLVYTQTKSKELEGLNLKAPEIPTVQNPNNQEIYREADLSKITAELIEDLGITEAYNFVMIARGTDYAAEIIDQWLKDHDKENLIITDSERYGTRWHKKNQETSHAGADQEPDKEIKNEYENKLTQQIKERIQNKIKDESIRNDLLKELENSKNSIDRLQSLTTKILDTEKEQEKNLSDFDLSNFGDKPFSETNNLEVEELDLSKVNEENAEDIAIQKEAEEIYQDGNALKYMINTCQSLHVGDQYAQMGMILSFAATRVLNSKGIHIYLSGKAGAGKSHCAGVIVKILPNGQTLSARLSDKAVFRFEGLKPETAIIVDDQSMSSTFGEIFKNGTTDWNNPVTYMVSEKENGKWVTVARQTQIRCPYWYIKANQTGDEQTRDRQLKFDITNDEEQLKAIRNMQNEMAINPDLEKDDHAIKVCKKIWDLVKHETVVIPYTKDIICKELENTRTYNMMLELVCSLAILSTPLRKRDSKGYLIASIDDFKRACLLLNSPKGAQNDNLGPEAKELLKHLKTLPTGDYPFIQIREQFKFSRSRLHFALHGRDKDNPDIGGLCSLDGPIGTETSGRECVLHWNREVYEEVCDQKFSLFVMDPTRRRYWEDLEN